MAASPDLISTAEAARRLGVSQSSVARWADAGRLPCTVTPGGWRRFRPADVDTFAAECARVSA